MPNYLPLNTRDPTQYFVGVLIEFHAHPRAYRLMEDGGLWIRKFGTHDWEYIKQFPGSIVGKEMTSGLMAEAYKAMNKWRITLSGRMVKGTKARKLYKKFRGGADRRERKGQVAMLST